MKSFIVFMVAFGVGAFLPAGCATDKVYVLNCEGVQSLANLRDCKEEEK